MLLQNGLHFANSQGFYGVGEWGTLKTFRPIKSESSSSPQRNMVARIQCWGSYHEECVFNLAHKLGFLLYSGYFSRGVYFADFAERAQFANFETSKFNH